MLQLRYGLTLDRNSLLKKCFDSKIEKTNKFLCIYDILIYYGIVSGVHKLALCFFFIGQLPSYFLV